MIGVVIPAHNEQAHLDCCLAALQRAAQHVDLLGEPVAIIVVLDACTDDSLQVAQAHGVRHLSIQARNVGAARSRGARALLAEGVRWLGFTDADSIVSPRWLVDQLALRADAVCGCVTVADWSGHSPAVRARYEAEYHSVDGHRHIHGANLGVSARAYESVGGFADLRVAEDVALVNALMDSGANVAWSAVPQVTTSARRHARASGGFADFLIAIADRVDNLVDPTGRGEITVRMPAMLSIANRFHGLAVAPDAANAALK